jgi:xanthine dehydrogenase YagR molybdenum-binding subunit
MNPLTATSQINGAVIQGLSYTLFENRLLDRQTAIMVNSNLEQYKIAGARDVPQIEVVMVENYAGKSNTDATGLAEPAIVATPASIANAVYNAIGVRVRELPMTPARVLAALAGKAATAERSAGA